MKVIRDSVATVAQSFCWSWSGMLQPLTNLNKHPRSAACRAPPGVSVTACTGMGNWNNFITAVMFSIVGDKMRMDGTAELTIVGGHWDCDCDSVASFPLERTQSALI